ncbi:hypothetical protein PRZ48_009072 [Zasmidium cellare]|uniref:Uncharacterized protein n=1 Tax=Zasmidium cellare TaxID=395010 RepID=A0ABR0EI98_ZASCE|nr:hypothetical protein PRZ48_009072 [Zasmidium cellare]
MSFTVDASTNSFDLSSTDEYDSLDDLAPDSQSEFDKEQAAKTYWLGKKFMVFALEYSAVRLPSPDETDVDVDVKVEAKFRKWPYTSTLGTMLQAFETVLPHNLRSNTSDDYEAFMCGLGCVLVGIKEQDGPVVDTLLESLGGGEDGFAKALEKNLKKPNVPETVKDGTPARLTDIAYYKHVRAFSERKGSDIEKYTTKMKNGRGWMTTMKVLGREFSGKGWNPQEATQKAAQRAFNAYELGGE